MCQLSQKRYVGLFRNQCHSKLTTVLHSIRIFGRNQKKPPSAGWHSCSAFYAPEQAYSFFPHLVAQMAISLKRLMKTID
jgi:hypothetical protein